MRLQIAAAGGPPASHNRPDSVIGRLVSRPGRLDWFERLALAVFGVISLWIVALDVLQVIAHGQIWTGTDGVYITDQMQYLAWIRSASHHVLISNLFVLRHTSPVYFQPAIAASGGLVALGVAPWVALLVWKPIAVLVSFWGVRWYVRRSLTETWPRRAALVLALFFASISVIYGSPGVVGDLFLGFLSWGYTFGLLSVGVMLLALLFYDRARSSQAAQYWALAAAALLGALASLLHPWQGELVILIVVGAEAWTWRRAGRRRTLAEAGLVVAATAAPLIYYIGLGALDHSWQLARVASKHGFPLLSIGLGLLPLALFALPAYRGRPASFLEAATRVWPLAALAIYVAAASDVSATPLHAFQGVTVPLAILATRGAQRLGIRRLPAAGAVATALVAAATVPAIVVEMRSVSTLVKPTPGNPNFIARDEQRALRYLDRDPDPGGVLTRFYLGTVVPAETGRRTFVGDCIWSEPNCNPRAELAQQVFDGTLPRGKARAFVLSTGARFVLADCQTSRDMDELLGPITLSVRHFGCAAVYELATANDPEGPLAESAPDAPLRASGRQQRGVKSA
jgi:hypothetical protein